MREPNLQHRIDVQRKDNVVDPSTGYSTAGWATRLSSLPAEWLPGPGSEFLAAESLRAEITGRFTLRWSTDAAAIVAGDRVIWDGRTMKVKAPPLVDTTARRWITLMVAEDGGDGS